MPLPANERLIAALDVSSIESARSLVQQLEGLVSFFKVGFRLHLAPGLSDFIDWLNESGRKVFLDYKYYDVEETVQGAVRLAAERGITFVTVHGSGGTIRAAVRGRGENGFPKILIVTVLTSLDATDITAMGFPCSVEDLVVHRAKMALQAGCDGVIASGKEARAIRSLAQDRLLIVTPGVRLADTSTDEHKRPVTPSDAIASGADYLVIGRPILNAPDARHAAERIVNEMQEAFQRRAE